MNYTKHTWYDYYIPEISTTHLNEMESGIGSAQGDVMVLRGTLVARPASDPLLVGRLYFTTDTNELFRDNGSGWDQAILDHNDLVGVTATQHHLTFIGLEDNAAVAVTPAADDRIQFTDDGVINADAVGNTIALSVAEDQIIPRGLTANRPTPNPAFVGRLYIESDLLLQWWRDNGTGWDLVKS